MTLYARLQELERKQADSARSTEAKLTRLNDLRSELSADLAQLDVNLVEQLVRYSEGGESKDWTSLVTKLQALRTVIDAVAQAIALVEQQARNEGLAIAQERNSLNLRLNDYHQHKTRIAEAVKDSRPVEKWMVHDLLRNAKSEGMIENAMAFLKQHGLEQIGHDLSKAA